MTSVNTSRVQEAGRDILCLDRAEIVIDTDDIRKLSESTVYTADLSRAQMLHQKMRQHPESTAFDVNFTMMQLVYNQVAHASEESELLDLLQDTKRIDDVANEYILVGKELLGSLVHTKLYQLSDKYQSQLKTDAIRFRKLIVENSSKDIPDLLKALSIIHYLELQARVGFIDQDYTKIAQREEQFFLSQYTKESDLLSYYRGKHFERKALHFTTIRNPELAFFELVSAFEAYKPLVYKVYPAMQAFLMYNECEDMKINLKNISSSRKIIEYIDIHKEHIPKINDKKLTSDLARALKYGREFEWIY